MKPLLIASAAVLAALATATPAVAGLAGNSSFSHRLPVRVPSSAEVVSFDDHGGVSGDNRRDRPASSAATSHSATSTATAEPGDDRSTSTAPGDDRGGASPSSSAEPGDDHGSSTAPGDDRGGASPSSSAEPGDDRGSSTEPGDDRGGATSNPTSVDSHGGSSHGGGK